MNGLVGGPLDPLKSGPPLSDTNTAVLSMSRSLCEHEFMAVFGMFTSFGAALPFHGQMQTR